MKKIKKIQNEHQSLLERLKAAKATREAAKATRAENLRQYLDDHPELKEAHEARQWAKLRLESFEDDTVSYEDSWWWRRPGYHRGIGLDDKGCWVADTPDYERQRAIEKKLSAQGVPDEVIETVLWVNNEVAKESANETHVQQPKPKRKSGRKSVNDNDQRERGIKILVAKPKLKGRRALDALRNAGIEGGRTTMYEIIKAAKKVRK